MLVMLASTVFATSAFAEDPIIWGAISIENNYYIYATNTSTSQMYYVLIHADHSGVNYLNVPPGTYDVRIYIDQFEVSDMFTTWDYNNIYDVYDYTYYSVSLSADQIEVVTVGHFD